MQLNRKIFTDIVVSTDSKNIIKYYNKNKNVLFHKRPKNLSKDDSSVIKAIEHYLTYSKKNYEKYNDIATH